jgi:hypothetical protein
MNKLLLVTTIVALHCFTVSLPIDNKKITLSKFSSDKSDQWLKEQIGTLDYIISRIKEIRIYNEYSGIITNRTPKDTFQLIEKHITTIDAMINDAIAILYAPKELIKPYTLTHESKNFPKSSAITTLAHIDMAFVALEQAVQNPKNKENKQTLINLRSKTIQKIKLLKKINNNIKNSRTSYKERFGATLLAKTLEILQLSIEKVAELLNIDLQESLQERKDSLGQEDTDSDWVKP